MFQIAMTRIDVTPDSRGSVGFLPPAKYEKPLGSLYARLFLIDSGTLRVLAVSIDYGGIYFSTQKNWRKRLADVLGIPPERVILHCIHLHDAPFINIETVRLTGKSPDQGWMDVILDRLAKAAASLPANLKPVAKLGWSEARVHGFASNRRVPLDDGTIGIRWSRTQELNVRNRPVGLIDPMLRTLGFYGSDGNLLAAWSFYATHPQVGNEGKRYGSDSIGEAMKQLGKRFPDALNSYFTGCSGNVTAGKYSDPYDTQKNIRHFGTLVAETIARNLKSQELSDAGECSWRTEGFPFPAKHFTAEELSARERELPTVGITLQAAQDYAAQNPETFTLSMLKLGGIRILFLPSELFVEYQLFLQGLVPDEKIGIAENCGGDFLYVGTAETIRDPSGYETKSLCRAKPEFEELFHAAARKLLAE